MAGTSPQTSALSAPFAPPEKLRKSLRRASVDRVLAAITQRDFSTLTPEDAWSWNLTGWLFGVLPTDHPLRRPLMLDYTRHQVRHTRLQSALAELQKAWSAAGIHYFAFKGIVLQQVYPDSRMRFYGDIDLYVPEEHLSNAISTLPPGWTFHSSPSPETHHNAGTLLDGHGQKIVDLHQSLLPIKGVRAVRRRQLHAAFESEATSLQLREGDMPLPAFNWADQVLISLVINRGWCHDHWRPKAADYLDLEQLLENGWVTLDGLQKRAASLGLSHSFRAFLSICNPQTGVFHLQRSLRQTRTVPTWLDWASFRDGCKNEIFVTPYYALTLLIDMAIMAPLLLDVLRSLRQHDNPRAVILGVHRRRALHWHEGRYIRAIKWSTRLLLKARLTQVGPCVIHSLALLTALRNDGIATTWVQGFRKQAAGGRPGHAWVERNGRVLAHEGDPVYYFAVSMRIDSEGNSISDIHA